MTVKSELMAIIPAQSQLRHPVKVFESSQLASSAYESEGKCETSFNLNIEKASSARPSGTSFRPQVIVGNEFRSKVVYRFHSR